MVYMAFKNPIMGLVGTNQAFERFESDTNKAKILQVKLAYIVMQLVALGVGIWKVNGMGLLPYVLPSCARHLDSDMLTTHRTTRSDWLAWEAQRDPLEHAVSAF